MQVKKLIQCPVCGTKYIEDTVGGCPTCNGGKTGVVRSLAEKQPPRAAYRQTGYEAEAICGWLVCVSGAGKGGYFRIIGGKNLISDEKDNRVTVRYDQTQGGGVSGMILFDGVKNEFWLLNGCGHDIVRVNGELLLNAVRLKRDDTLEIGKTVLVFAPFCGEMFQWSDRAAEVEKPWR